MTIYVITTSKIVINDKLFINCNDLYFCDFLSSSDTTIKFYPVSGNDEVVDTDEIEKESMTIEELRDYFYD